MAYDPTLRGVAWVGYITLTDRATMQFRANPTIAAGDFKVSIDGGAFANLATLPSVEPAGSVALKISLAPSETDGNNIKVVGIDQAGAEWSDYDLTIQTQQPSVALGGTALPAGYLGDIKIGDTIDFQFTTVDRNLQPETLEPNVAPGPSTPVVVSIYRNNSLVETVAGITLDIDYDAHTGLNHVRAALTVGNGYAAGDNLTFVITNGSISGLNTRGLVVASATIQARIVSQVTGSVGSVVTDTQPGPTSVPVVGDVPSPYQTGLMILQSLSSISNDRITGIGTVTLPDGSPYYEVQTNDGENPTSVARIG